MARISSIENSGFQIETTNGYCVSVRFSTHSYCKRYGQDEIFSELKERMVNSSDCEVAVIHNHEWVIDKVIDALELDIFSDGMVAGNVSPDDLAKIIGYVVTME